MSSGTTTVGKVQYIVDVDTSGLITGIKEAENTVSKSENKFGSSAKNIAGKVGGALATVGKAAVAAGAAAVTAIGGVIATGGFDRAMNVEQAQFKLKGLGHDAESVDAIMKNALASVKGTAYGLGDAATVAASVVAAGVKPGQELERTLKLIGDAAAISGRDMTEMGAIFNKVAAAGKLTGQELNQLTDSGIPVLQLLGDSLGKTTDEVREMVSAGKVGFAEFQNAIEKGMGGAALTMGETFSGALANVKAAMSRLGETIMTPMAQGLTPVLGILISMFDDIGSGITDNIGKNAAKVGEMMNEVLNNFVNNLAPIIQNIVPVVVELLLSIIRTLPSLLTNMLPVILDSVTQLIMGIVRALPSLLQALVAAIPIVIDAVVKMLSGFIDALPIILPQIISGLVGMITTLIKQITRPDFLIMVIKAAITLLMEIVKAIPQIIVALVEALPDIIMNIIDFFTNPSTLKMMIDAAVTLFLSLVNAIPQILGALIGAFGNLFSQLWNKLQGMFSDFAGNFGQSIGNIFKNAINGVLGYIEQFINNPIEIINGAIGVLNAIPGIDIGKIPRVYLPRMATGGIVEATPGGRAIIAGEGGQDEWVVPESKMASLIDKIGGSSGQNITINVSGTFATSPAERRAVADQIVEALNQTQRARLGATI